MPFLSKDWRGLISSNSSSSSLISLESDLGIIIGLVFILGRQPATIFDVVSELLDEIASLNKFFELTSPIFLSPTTSELPTRFCLELSRGCSISMYSSFSFSLESSTIFVNLEDCLRNIFLGDTIKFDWSSSARSRDGDN